MTLLLRQRAKRRISKENRLSQERTGHRSIKALQMFERTTTCQHVAVSNILSSPTEVNLPQSTVHGSLLMQVYLFASASNCAININMATPVAGLEAVNTTD